MAVISFTAADAMQTKVIPAGIYPSEVTKIDGPKPSSSGKSNTFFVDVQITDGPYKGKERTLAFNTGTKSPSVLGEAQFFPDSYFLQLDAAIQKKDVLIGDYQLDTDSLLRKPFDAAWGVATEEGHMFNVINNFHPAGYAAAAPAF